MPGLRLERHDGAATAAMLDTLTDVYLDEYAEPPYEGSPVHTREAFTERTTRQVSAEGFTLVTGHTDAALAGYTFGFRQPPGRWLPGTCEPPPPAQIVESPRFFVVELIVRRPFRRRGYARQLMDELLTARPEPFAALTAHPRAPARTIYPRWGWDELCKLSWDDGTSFDVMVKRLNPIR